ncbi:hypothetical protein AM1_B0352 (plasmid) [Acaryochloris marina MBIC11017]|uniref:Uncharacterized protein n=1 Tax=Acaryochloris marina (strain MBIC 11017) TaxID=329726 RepID=A8ZLP3_ACAM1|nr:hypothetical protein AM1_B0352 [Acaryochloris marina MBIC11017]
MHFLKHHQKWTRSRGYENTQFIKECSEFSIIKAFQLSQSMANK